MPREYYVAGGAGMYASGGKSTFSAQVRAIARTHPVIGSSCLLAIGEESNDRTIGREASANIDEATNFSTSLSLILFSRAILVAQSGFAFCDVYVATFRELTKRFNIECRQERRRKEFNQASGITRSIAGITFADTTKCRSVNIEKRTTIKHRCRSTFSRLFIIHSITLQD